MDIDALANRLEESLVPLISNPFEVSKSAFGKAKEQFLRNRQDVRAWIHALAESSNLSHRHTAFCLVLAEGHSQIRGREALSLDEQGIFSSGWLPDSVWDALDRKRDEIRGLLRAADRANTEISKIRGNSKHVKKARADAWRLSFGHRLDQSLSIRTLLRETNVFILGPTGCGKEGVASAIMAGTISPEGRDPPRLVKNVAAIPRELAESELFGHIEGAFTGARSERVGILEAANGGTLFLDEVADLDLHIQPKLLRVIETGKVRRLGSHDEHDANARFLAATSRPIDEMIENDRFRRDLFARLAAHVVRIPPLRDRPEDIKKIGRHEIDVMVAQTTNPKTGISPLAERRTEVEAWLESPEAAERPWHGNVRELKNTLRSMLMGLPTEEVFSRHGASGGAHLVPDTISSGRATLAELEQWYLRRVFAEEGDNKTRAASRLGIDRGTLDRKMRQGS